MANESVQLGDDVLENAYYRMLDAAPDALVIADAEGTIRLVNAQAEAVFGYQRKELLGAPIEVLLPEHLRAAHVAHRDHFATAPKVREMGSGLPLYGRRKDGSTFPLEVSLSPLKTEAGLFVLSALRDVTDRKRAEQEARVQGERLLSAVESIQGMFVLFDKDDRMVLCNSSFRQFFEPAITGSIAGRSFAELVDGSMRCELFDLEGASPEEFRATWAARHQQPGKSFEMRTRDGRTLRFSDRLTGGGDTVKTIWDVTDDVRAADELRRAHVVAESASSAKSEFLASMSHELRTPLNAILGFAQLLQRDKKTPLTERQRVKVDHILKGGEHLLRLIDDVLDLARIEAGRVTISLEPVEVIEVLREVRTTLESLATRSEVELSLDEDTVGSARVHADRVRFAQVLMNFGSNAIKYGKRLGRVHFVLSRPEEGIVRVSVLDDGAGIPPEKQGKLFEPFQRAGQELGPIEGTGIGLMICKRLATIMGGAVGFRSEPGVGSEFWIDLPEQWGHQLALPKPSAQTPRVASLEGVRRVVVYIEDNPSNIAFMQDVMEDLERVELLTAPSAELGIELVRARQPDLVLMDINLPGINGIEATRRLKEWPETRDIPVVALTAAALMRDAQRKEIVVFDRYLTKPLKVDELMALLVQLFEQRPLMER